MCKQSEYCINQHIEKMYCTIKKNSNEINRRYVLLSIIYITILILALITNVIKNNGQVKDPKKMALRLITWPLF